PLGTQAHDRGAHAHAGISRLHRGHHRSGPRWSRSSRSRASSHGERGVSTTKAVRTTRDTYANHDRAATSFASETTVRVRADGASHGRQSFLAFGAMPVGARIISATLFLTHYAALTGSRTLT